MAFDEVVLDGAVQRVKGVIWRLRGSNDHPNRQVAVTLGPDVIEMMDWKRADKVVLLEGFGEDKGLIAFKESELGRPVTHRINTAIIHIPKDFLKHYTLVRPVPFIRFVAYPAEFSRLHNRLVVHTPPFLCYKGS